MRIAGKRWPVWLAAILAVFIIGGVWVIAQGGEQQPVDAPQQPLPPEAPGNENGPDENVPGGPAVPGIPSPGGSYAAPDGPDGRAQATGSEGPGMKGREAYTALTGDVSGGPSPA